MLAKMATEGSELAIEVKDVYKQYGRGRKAVKVLKGINVDVPYNSIYALLGASGCGKTTLLRCCLGFIRPNKGNIVVLGAHPGARGMKVPGKDLGYMPQDLGLVYELSILETMYFFGMMFRMGFQAIGERAKFLVDLLELPPLNKRIKDMSGGEQRRVSFAVSLVQKPPLLIMDEPTVGMDSLLRQSVWEYIEKLTVAKECTVVITTHYIDEARRANTVGLMRGGKLLTQSRPDELIRTHNAVTLEEVFVKLAYRQEQDEDKMTTSVLEVVDNKQSIQYTENFVTVQQKAKKLNFVDNYFPRYLWGINIAIILAITAKITAKTLRSILSLFGLLSIPLINILGLVYFVGGDIRNVKVFSHNEDTNSTDVQNFLTRVDTSDEFRLVEVSRSDITRRIRDGDGPVGLVIEYNFTESLLTRFEQVCEAQINPNVDYPSYSLVKYSTIPLSVDATDVQLLTQSLMRLNVKGEELLDSIFEENFHASFRELFGSPVQLVEEVYGSTSWEYRDYVGSTVLAALMFYNAIAITALNFILEGKEGLFERSYAAGASVTDFIIAYTLHGSVILLLQVIILMVVVFAIIGVELVGSVFLLGLLVWLTGMIGFFCGLLISSQVPNELAAQNSVQTFGGTIAFLSGFLWSKYGQPTVVRFIATFLPVTKPTEAGAAIGTKDFGLGDEPVYVGFLVAIAWLIVIYIVSVAFYKTV